MVDPSGGGAGPRGDQRGRARPRRAVAGREAAQTKPAAGNGGSSRSGGGGCGVLASTAHDSEGKKT